MTRCVVVRQRSGRLTHKHTAINLNHLAGLTLRFGGWAITARGGRCLLNRMPLEDIGRG